MSKSKYSQNQLDILNTYIKIVKEKKMHPRPDEMLAFGLTRHKIRHAFSSMAGLRVVAKQYKPEAFKDVIDSSIFSRKIFKELVSEANTFDRFVVTTAVMGCHVDQDFLASIDSYCKKHKAMLLILIAADPAAKTEWQLDPLLKGRNIVFSDMSLNQNLYISTIKLSAKHIDPITGLGRIGQRNGSFIYASPKQRLKMVATSVSKPPVALMTTGAITAPDYSTDRYMSERTAYIAENDHVMGAIVVEIKNNKRFFFRQVQADKDGAFVDLGVMYDGEYTEEYRPDAMVFGDLHCTETDPWARAGGLEVIKKCKPRRLIIHDGFSGVSINHHDREKVVTQAKLAHKKKLNLENELTELATELDVLADTVSEVVMVKSNHDEFLERYLESGWFVQDPHNLKIALQLALAMVDGKDPLKYAMEEVVGLSNARKIRWLDRDEDFKVAGVELGAHGDLGANGGAATPYSLENAYGHSMSGHTHVAEILRGVWKVGTKSYTKLGYNRGMSSWTHTDGLVYPNGMRQLIFYFDGEWKL